MVEEEVMVVEEVIVEEEAHFCHIRPWLLDSILLRC